VAGPRYEAQDSTVVLVSEGQRAQSYATLVSAFFEDPVERWLYPTPQEYRTHFPEFLSAFGGKAFQHETVWTLGEFSAVALWLPSGIEPDGDLITAVLTETVDPSKHDDLFSVLTQMDAAHPRDAHWYLPWFGVTADLQGRGLGGTLMTHCLSVVDASHLPAYLETPSPRNITFYERHGFAVTGEAQAGQCPPVTFMSRAAH
jgi:GNAT superfamily N-acetyltransferase